MKTDMTVLESFDETIVDSDLSSIPADLLEQSIDAIMEDGILQSIPIVRTIVGAIKTAGNIQDRLFLNKILSFLFHLKDVDPRQRQEMINNIDRSGICQVRVGQKLLYIIDKCDDHTKSAYVARIFKAFIQSRISYSEFLRTLYAINNISSEDIISFLRIPNGQDLNGIDCFYYMRAGLVDKLSMQEMRAIEGGRPGGYLVGTMYNRYTREGEIIRQELR